MLYIMSDINSIVTKYGIRFILPLIMIKQIDCFIHKKIKKLQFWVFNFYILIVLSINLQF